MLIMGISIPVLPRVRFTSGYFGALSICPFGSSEQEGRAAAAAAARPDLRKSRLELFMLKDYQSEHQLYRRILFPGVLLLFQAKYIDPRQLDFSQKMFFYLQGENRRQNDRDRGTDEEEIVDVKNLVFKDA